MSSPVSIVPRKMRTSTKILLWFVLILLLIGLWIGTTLYAAWQITHPDKVPLTENPSDYGLIYEEVTFRSLYDDIALQGWYIPSMDVPNEKGTTLILSHGYGHNRAAEQVPMLELAKRLSSEGFAIFLFDFRNSGESEGEYTSFGEYETYDLLAAINWVKERDDHKVGLLGFSSGAATSLLAAAQDKSVIGVVSDSSFGELSDYLDYHVSEWSILPSFLFTPIMLNALEPWIGIHPEKVAPLHILDQIYPRPILFIHSQTDQTVKVTESLKMAAAYPDQFQLWETTGPDHSGSFSMFTDAYIEKIVRFFNH